MPFQTVTLRPGVNVELTQLQNQAGYSDSNLIRFRDGLAEKMGGWTRFYTYLVSGKVRALHAWQDLNENKRLAIGSTQELSVILSGTLSDITPQELTSDFDPDITTSASSTTVTIDDPNVSGPTTLDAVEFRTPVSCGGIILHGVYPISLVLGATNYEITVPTAASTTRRPLTITNITQANPAVVTYSGADDIANGDLVYIYGVEGMTEVNGAIYTVANLNAGANTFELSGVDSSAYTAYSANGVASSANVPEFTTISGSTSVTVKLQDHGLAAAESINFALSTSVGGLTILGTYQVTSVTDTDNFVITLDDQASSSASAFMNSGQVELVYHITIGPVGTTAGYGTGTYGTGGYGTGVVLSQQTGSTITPNNWTLDNWGEILLANAEGSGIYWWRPQIGYQNAKLVAEAPRYNNGIFVSMPAQILVAYGSTAATVPQIGEEQDPLLVRWCDIENFFEWTASSTTQAGSYRIPTGSRIVGGMQARNYGLLWTDIDLYAMNYVNSPLVYAFNKISANCGLVGKHAFVQMGGRIYWMGRRNFFRLAGQVEPVPCSVWSYIFQDLDEDNLTKCIAGSNTPFNEIAFFFPSDSGGTGEPDKYVKFNTLSGEWDKGTLGRTAWIDQSVLGNPIGAASDGSILTHESGYDAVDSPMNPSFTTGYWTIGNGQDFAVVDYILPDFKYGTIAGTADANILATFYVRDGPNDTVRTYGPFEITTATKYVPVRFRGREMAMKIESNDNDSFWRVGAVRFRYAMSGRR